MSDHKRRYHNEDGVDFPSKECEELITQAFNQFVKEGFFHRDFIDFVISEGMMEIFDYEIDTIFGEAYYEES